jgi:hypothetical protein
MHAPCHESEVQWHYFCHSRYFNYFNVNESHFALTSTFDFQILHSNRSHIGPSCIAGIRKVTCTPFAET